MADREKVIKGLEICIRVKDNEKCPDECPYRKDICYGTVGLMADALSLLKAPEPGWISVDERLPEPFTLVLGYMAWGGYDVLQYENQRFYTPGSFQPLPIEAVTHWMPLPEPPKEG